MAFQIDACNCKIKEGHMKWNANIYFHLWLSSPKRKALFNSFCQAYREFLQSWTFPLGCHPALHHHHLKFHVFPRIYYIVLSCHRYNLLCFFCHQQNSSSLFIGLDAEISVSRLRVFLSWKLFCKTCDSLTESSFKQNYFLCTKNVPVWLLSAL